MKDTLHPKSLPTAEQIIQELYRSVTREQCKRVFRFLGGILLTAALAIVIIAVFVFTPYTVEDGSMAPTLLQGRLLLCERVETSDEVTDHTFEHGELVLIKHHGQYLLRRVLAVPGDEIGVIEDGEVWLNGLPADEPYRTKGVSVNDQTYPLTVPEGKLFVMADQREGTEDSRSVSFGLVAESSVVGVPQWVAWPLTELGRLDDGRKAETETPSGE